MAKDGKITITPENFREENIKRLDGGIIIANKMNIKENRPHQNSKGRNERRGAHRPKQIQERGEAISIASSRRKELRQDDSPPTDDSFESEQQVIEK